MLLLLAASNLCVSWAGAPSLAPSRARDAARAALPLGPPSARAGGWQVISQGAWDHLLEPCEWWHEGATSGSEADFLGESLVVRPLLVLSRASLYTLTELP